jgi:hypothetical protein
MLNTLTLPKTFEFFHKWPLLSLINNFNFIKTHILHIEKIKFSLQIPRVICCFTLTHINNTKTTKVLVKTLVILKVSSFSWTPPIIITWLHSLVGLQKMKQKILYLLQNILIPTSNTHSNLMHTSKQWKTIAPKIPYDTSCFPNFHPLLKIFH